MQLSERKFVSLMVNKIELKGVCKAYKQNDPVIEDLNLRVDAGSFTVLLGPSGCGKSTILRMIAGLEKETDGQILIDGKLMKNCEPGDRNIAMVFQNYALYPTMTVRENIEFGLINMRVPKNEREKRISEVSEIVGLTDYLKRKPGTLSGGQRQRVALARAIVKKPQIFLMDEPLSNLDAKLRNQLRGELIELYRRLNVTFLFVTHDQVEAMSMGTDIVLLKDGKIMQQASPLDIYHTPTNVFTAQFIGSPSMNVIDADNAGALKCFFPDTAGYLGFRPESAKLRGLSEKTEESCLSFTGELLTREMLGTEQLYKISTSFGQMYVKLYDAKPVEYGLVRVIVKKEHLHYFDKDQRRISSTPKAGEQAG